MSGDEIQFAAMPHGDDFILPFQIESLQIRGRLVRLSTVADTIIRQHAYPQPIARLVGESCAITAALAHMLKFAGVFTLQIKTDGPVRFLISDITSEGHLRSYCNYETAEVLALAQSAEAQMDFPAWMGQGYLAFTVDQGPAIERHQGIVALSGKNLSECVGHYFAQSEQLQTRLRVASRAAPSLAGRDHWRAGAVMLQRLPLEGGTGIRLDYAAQEDGWRRLQYLLDSCTDAELTDPYLTADALLYRLFNEDGVRVFKSQSLMHKCRCSRERVETVLRQFPYAELQDMEIDGKLEVRCQFCNHNEVFLLADLAEPAIIS